MILALSVFSVFGFALVAPWLVRRAGNVAGWILAILPAALTLYLASLLPLAAAGQPAVFSIPWSPELGLFISFRADGLGLLFALLISGVGTLVVVYAGGYLQGHPALGKFFAWLFVFMGSMLGLALADNMLLLFVFWELTSISSYMLIGFEHEREAARAAAQQAFLITAGGGQQFLGGIEGDAIVLLQRLGQRRIAQGFVTKRVFDQALLAGANLAVDMTQQNRRDGGNQSLW